MFNSVVFGTVIFVGRFPWMSTFVSWIFVIHLHNKKNDIYNNSDKIWHIFTPNLLTLTTSTCFKALVCLEFWILRFSLTVHVSAAVKISSNSSCSAGGSTSWSISSELNEEDACSSHSDDSDIFNKRNFVSFVQNTHTQLLACNLFKFKQFYKAVDIVLSCELLISHWSSFVKKPSATLSDRNDPSKFSVSCAIFAIHARIFSKNHSSKLLSMYQNLVRPNSYTFPQHKCLIFRRSGRT